MKRRILLICALLVSVITLTGAANVITFTTAKAVGETVTLSMIYTGDAPTLTGLDGTPQDNRPVTYTLTAQTVTIQGNVTSFGCDNNQITTLDVSQNTALIVLNCNTNQLTALDLSKNTALDYLDCKSNQLNALDLSKNTKLTALRVYNNQLTELDLSKNTELAGFYGSNNKLTALNLSKNTKLKRLDCKHNQLNALDVSKNTSLKALNCGGNRLNALDVSKNTKLEWLYCEHNQLTALDLSQNTALKELDCYHNKLTELDLSQNTALNKLNCDHNQLTALDLSPNTALTSLQCERNQLTELDLSQNLNLTTLYCEGNKLTDLDLSKNTNLTRLWCGINQLTTLDVSHNTALREFGCFANDLTALDLSHNTDLGALWCYGNYIKGEEMTRLVNSLPDRTGKYTGTFVVIQDPAPEGNVCLKPDVAIAEEKNWTAYVKDSNEDLITSYEGEEPTPFTVTFTKVGKGTLVISGASNLDAVPYGTELTIEAYPDAGYELTALTANGADILATKKVVVKGATEVKAIFTKKTYAVTLTKEGEGTLTATGATDLNAVPYGTELTIGATPAAGYELTALTANGADILATKKFTVTAATEVKATFTKKTAAEVVEAGTLRLYPNPASTYVNIKGAKADALVRLYDAKGALRYEARTAADGSLQIDLSAYAEGTYLLHVGSDAQRLLILR